MKFKTTVENSVKFTLLRLESGHKYFICARTLGSCEAMTSCSNGFVVDLEPPMKGYVEVTTMRGLTVPVDSHVRVTWHDFYDDSPQDVTGYVTGVKGYEVALGNHIKSYCILIHNLKSYLN